MTEEIMTTGERFYSLIQDIEEYIQHNRLEQDKELDFILSQSEELQSDYVRLEQENKELKEKLKSREDELANIAEQANMRINNYRSALEDIRDIVFGMTKDRSNVDTILDKIQEVLNDK